MAEFPGVSVGNSGKAWEHYNRTLEKTSKHPHSQPVARLSC